MLGFCLLFNVDQDNVVSRRSKMGNMKERMEYYQVEDGEMKEADK